MKPVTQMDETMNGNINISDSDKSTEDMFPTNTLSLIWKNPSNINPNTFRKCSVKPT